MSFFHAKIGAPYNPEFALGAITETGQGFFNQETIAYLGVSAAYLKAEIEKEKKLALHRLEIYRNTCPKICLEDKTVILIDDGLATGATMKAAIQAVKVEGACHVIAGIPVAPMDTLKEIQSLTDEAVVLRGSRVVSSSGRALFRFFSYIR